MKKNDLALIKWIDEFSKYGYIVINSGRPFLFDVKIFSMKGTHKNGKEYIKLMYSFFAKNMCKSVLLCLYIIIMNRNGNIVSMRPKSSVDSVQKRFLFILYSERRN